MKLLVVLAAIALLVWLLRRDLPAAAQARKAAQKGKPAAPSRPQGPEAMVRCATCGLHLPASDALPAPDARHYYCCAEHRQQSTA